MLRSSAARFDLSKPLPRRKGAIAVLAAFLMVLMVACIAFAIDLGHLFVVRGQAQSCADAAALAGAWTLVGDDHIRQQSASALATAARQEAIETAAFQDVNNSIRSTGPCNSTATLASPRA